MGKKFLSILLTLVLVLGLLPAAGAAAVSTSPTFSDMPDNWATEALESAVANGLLVGDDGKIMPDSPLTRAQMATIIVRAFGATEEGDISEYADVKSNDWFAVSMAKAYKMGVMQGYAGKMEPNSNITREQAFAVLARALKLEISSSINKTFEDEGEISDWAKGEVYALVNAGYIQGSNGRLNPQANISRAEFAQMMHNLIKQYIKAEGEYTQVADGNIMVNVPNVTLKNVTITGDLIVGDGVGDGALILDNVTIKGRLIVRGGVNSIIIIGGSVEDGSTTNNSQGTDVITPPPSGGYPSYVAVSAISVEPKELTLTVGDTGTITATVEPDNATNKEVTWTSSDETVATVDENGKVTAVAAGTVTITAKTDNGMTATTTVIILPAVEEGQLYQNNDGVYFITNADDLVTASTSYFDKGGKFIIANDIDMNGKTYTAPDVHNALTIDGNSKAIFNLTITPAASAGMGGSCAGLIGAMNNNHLSISSLTLDTVCVPNAADYAAGFVGQINSNGNPAIIKIDECHVNNYSAKHSKYNGGFIGGGTNNDKPDNNVTVSNSTVKNATIEGSGSTGGLIGHCFMGDAKANISNCSVTDSTLIYKGTDAVKAGSLIGTVNTNEVTVTNCSATNNIVTSGGNNVTTIYGRLVFGKTGKLTIDGKQMLADGLTYDADSDTYEISNANGLIYANKNLFNINLSNNKYKLGADIDMSDVTDWNSNVSQTTHFELDGGGYKISGLKTTSDALLVPRSQYTVTIKNLTLENCEVNTASKYAAMLVGYADANTVTIDNCNVINGKVQGANYAGALIGWSSKDININSSSVGNTSILGGGSTGGIVGQCVGDKSGIANITDVTIEDCTIKGERAEKSGIVVGTANVGKTTITTNSIVNNTVFEIENSDAIYGRFVPSTTGELIVNSTTIN